MKPTTPVQGSLFDTTPPLPTAAAEQPAPEAPTRKKMQGWAKFDRDQNPAHRLVLGRRWAAGPTALFVGLNPSKASAVKSDTTLAKIIGFTERLTDCGASVVGNLYSLIATDADDLVAAALRGDDVVHPDNDAELDRMAREASCIFVVVSGHPLVAHRLPAVVDILAASGAPLYCLGLTKDGWPLHPSRLGYDEGSRRPFTAEDLATMLRPKRRAR